MKYYLNFNKLSWIPFDDKLKRNKCSMLFQIKILHGMAPDHLLNKFPNEKNIIICTIEWCM